MSALPLLGCDLELVTWPHHKVLTVEVVGRTTQYHHWLAPERLLLLLESCDSIRDTCSTSTTLFHSDSQPGGSEYCLEETK
jgi:hypothetical protein